MGRLDLARDEYTKAMKLGQENPVAGATSNGVPAGIVEIARGNLALLNSNAKPNVVVSTVAASGASVPASIASGVQLDKESDQEREKNILLSVEEWRKSWVNKDLPAYFSSYVANYSGDFASPSVWRAGRAKTIGSAGNIDLVLSKPIVNLESSNRAKVTFEQFYRSNGYSDKGVTELSLGLDRNRWLIERESFKPKRQ